MADRPHSFSELKRRYVRLTEQELERVDRWELPTVGEALDLAHQGEQLGFFAPQPEPVCDGDDELLEAEAQEGGPVGFTAAELEEIRLAAYEEGLQQGLEEGRISGQQVGHAEGLVQGQEAGRKQGYEEGMAKADEALAQQRAELVSLLDNLSLPSRKLDALLMDELRELVCQVAEAVLYREVETSHSLVLEFIDQGLRTLPSLNQAIKVYLHGEDKQLLESQWQPEEQELELTLVTDAQLARGDCRLVTESSQVEFNWQQRLQTVTEQLRAQPVQPPVPTQTVAASGSDLGPDLVPEPGPEPGQNT